MENFINKVKFLRYYSKLMENVVKDFGVDPKKYLINLDVENERFYFYNTKSQSGFFITLDALDV